MEADCGSCALWYNSKGKRVSNLPDMRTVEEKGSHSDRGAAPERIHREHIHETGPERDGLLTRMLVSRS